MTALRKFLLAVTVAGAVVWLFGISTVSYSLICGGALVGGLAGIGWGLVAALQDSAEGDSRGL